ncbi:MAG: hypothetical protein K4571_03830 [Deltaproteobacteria bacterium]
MTEQKENKSKMGFAECFARMQSCCPAAGKETKIDFSACEAMMKSFPGDKEGKVNMEAMKSMMTVCCGGSKKDAPSAPEG